jgi:hypothetical protein
VPFVEYIPHKTIIFTQMYVASVTRDDACGILSAML